MNPAVKDASSYTFGLNAFASGDGHGGGGTVAQTSKWGVYVRPRSARVTYTINKPVSTATYTTSIYSNMPKAHPATGGNGGGPLNITDLSSC
jgi:hypothetical protein